MIIAAYPGLEKTILGKLNRESIFDEMVEEVSFMANKCTMAVLRLM